MEATSPRRPCTAFHMSIATTSTDIRNASGIAEKWASTDSFVLPSRSHRKPAEIQVDNGTEFASRALDAWAHGEDVRLDFSRPGSRRTTRTSSLSLPGCVRSA